MAELGVHDMRLFRTRAKPSSPETIDERVASARLKMNQAVLDMTMVLDEVEEQARRHKKELQGLKPDNEH